MAARFQKPTGAFVAASWAALFVGAIVFLDRAVERVHAAQ